MRELIQEEITDMDGINCYITKGVLIRCKDCTYRQDDGYCPITDCYDFDDKDYCSKVEGKEE